MAYKRFETERLKIRPANEEDASFYLELLNSPKWIKYVGKRDVKTEEEAQQYIRDKMMSQLERLGYSNYTIIRKEDDEKIGCCGLYDREGLDGVDIGFALLTAYEKRGYALEAATAIKEAAINEFGIQKLKAITIKENTASQKLLEKLGLRYVKAIKIAADAEEVMLYELPRDC